MVLFEGVDISASTFFVFPDRRGGENVSPQRTWFNGPVPDYRGNVVSTPAMARLSFRRRRKCVHILEHSDPPVKVSAGFQGSIFIFVSME